ncbi:redoxin domain-containing protein [Spirosoma rhododendri]|uniref:Peroxiredoxin n=1 Tax=Spirosoma rhododendri TaxID=2728024 RepID=A0A7L5DTP0_9BACT|nr:peroxiredoxin [Spirosoma rhododendri]QJD80663.1 peroxiredoxin [Spirosoma rhododendri]
MLTPGQHAPSFSLYNTEKKQVSLSDFSGKNLIMLFFPMAFTSTCTAELCQMRDDIATYAGMNADVVGISVDSPWTLAKFREEQHLPFDLLSDFNKEVSRAYETIYETYQLDLKGVSKRSAFVIDGDGIVRYAEVLESVKDVPSFANIQQVLSTLSNG